MRIRRLTALIGMAASVLASVAVVATPATAAPAPPPTPPSLSAIAPGGAVVTSPAGFTHPGILHSRADLDRTRAAVKLGLQPWARSFDAFRRTPYAQLDYVMQGPAPFVAKESTEAYRLESDGTAAYHQTLMWYITGNADNLAKARQLITAWATGMTRPMTDHIRGGPGVEYMTTAAEILRHTPGSGWTDADTTQYTAFLTLALNALDNPALFMNQGAFGTIGVTAAAVFTDDVALYQKTINRATVGDHPRPLEDVAISKHIWPSGQVVEMGRDQAHPQGGLGGLTEIAQTASIQGAALSNGLDLFTYLDNRLLRGYEYLAKFNLGYDQTYAPVDAAGNPGYYPSMSLANRGLLTTFLELGYNHYRYVNRLAPEQLRYTKQALDHLPDDVKTLMSTPLAGWEPGRPLGPPKPLTTIGIDPKFQRVQAAGFSASSSTNEVRNDYFTDADGTRAIIRDIRANAWVRYDDFDFGTTPADTFLLRAGVNSAVGSKVDIRLDSLTGELLGTARIEPTGWYTTFATTATTLARPLTGKHTIFLKFYGSTNVYNYQGGVDWIKVANRSAVVSNAATANDGATGTELVDNGAGGQGVRFSDGDAVTLDDTDFDNGSLTLRTRVATTGTGTLELHTGSATGPVVASYPLPDTAGAWQSVDRAMSRDAVYGRNNVVLVYKGAGSLTLDRYQFSPGLPPFFEVAGDSFYSEPAPGVRAYPPVDFSTGAKTLSVVVRSRSGGTIEVRADSLAAKPFAVITVPKLGNRDVRSVHVNLAGVSPTGSHLLFVTSTGIDKLQSFQLDPPNRAAPVITADVPTRWLVGAPLTVPVSAYDPDGAATTVAGYRLPTGAKLTAGALTWTPTAAQVGSNLVAVVADDRTTVALADRTMVVSPDATTVIDEVVAGAGDLSRFTPGGVQAFQRAVTDARTAAADPNATTTRKVAFLTALDAAAVRLRAPLPVDATGRIAVLTAGTVLASINSTAATGALPATEAGKPAFDGDTATAVDLAVPASWVQVDLGANGPVAFTKVRAFSRVSTPTRLRNAQFVGSNDGVNWTVVAQFGGTSTAGWNERPAIDTGSYRYLRMINVSNSIVAELEFYGQRVERALLQYAVTRVGALDPSAYTPAGWQAVVEARTAAVAADDDTSATQTRIDQSFAALDTAIANLQPAP